MAHVPRRTTRRAPPRHSRAGGNPGVSTAYSGVSAHQRYLRHAHCARCGADWVPAFAGTTPEGEGLIIAPADGKVVVIEEVEEPEYFKDKRKQISIFMSPVNVHVKSENKDPCSKRKHTSS